MFADAAVLLVGDELLSGRVQDCNLSSISAALAARGLAVAASHTSGDSFESIAAGLACLGAPGRLVVTTGGLGPTEDDLTPEAVARALGRAYREDPGAAAMIEDACAARGIPCPPSALRQARMPDGARPVRNPAGIAPGLVLELPDRCIVMLPGVPREVAALLDPCLDLAGAAGAAVEPATLRVWGIPETVLMDMIESEGLACGSPLAYLPRPGQVDLVVKDPSTGAVEALKARLGAGIYATGRSTTLEEALGTALTGAGMTLSTAESCTGGMLGGRITSVPGSSGWFAGGVVSYSDRAKEEILGVPGVLLREHGAVSGPVATAMAEGAARLLHARAAVSITGIAGPGGATPAKPVGTVWVGLFLDGPATPRLFRLSGGRAVVREAACTCAAGSLLALLGGRSEAG